MFGWLKKLFAKKPVDPVFHALTSGFCPDCKGTLWTFGPHGGCAQNITCEGCEAKFVVGPFDDGWCGTPMMAQRV